MLTQLEINQRVDEQEQIRTETRLLNEMSPFCWFCGCLENGTIEYEGGEIEDCPECGAQEMYAIEKDVLDQQEALRQGG